MNCQEFRRGCEGWSWWRWRCGGHLRTMPSAAHSPATFPLALLPRPDALHPHPSSSTSPGGLLQNGSLTHQRDDPGNLIMHTTKVCPPLTTNDRTTAAATLNPTARHPPLMHLHTEDRPNKVINQRPIFKWFAGEIETPAYATSSKFTHMLWS